MEPAPTSGPTGRIAVVLTVKNEADDILSWIAWYVSLGADTVLLHDDGSTDGTAEMADLAARTSDVRVVRLPQDGRLFIERQRDAYLDVLRRYGTKFEWIGFFDADEYLDLPPDTDLRAFLARGGDIGAVGVNWCNYGSSDHVLRPYDHPFNAYVHHYPAEIPINRHVKSFLRPAAWGGDWNNVHAFATPGHRYVDPVGNDIAWSGTFGITQGAPAWRGARLLHYQCRSMEQFVERMRKRPDLQKSVAVWDADNINAVRAEIAPRRLRRVTEALHDIVVGAVRTTLSEISPPAAAIAPVPSSPPARRGWFNRLARPADSLPGSTRVVDAGKASIPRPRLPPFRVWRSLSHHDTLLRLHPDTGMIVADLPVDAPEDARAGECLLLCFDERAAASFLILPATPGRVSAPVQMKGEIRVPRVLPFTPEVRDGQVTLRNPTSHRFLTALPLSAGGGVACNRWRADDWEAFRLLPAGHDQARDLVDALHLDVLADALLDPSVLLRDGVDPVASLPIVLALAEPAVTASLRYRLGTMMRYLT